jgi:nicotinamide-nucleotide amidase
MKAEIICVGTEILLGQILNTNQQWLSQKIAECGICVYYQSTVGDNPKRLAEAVTSPAALEYSHHFRRAWSHR